MKEIKWEPTLGRGDCVQAPFPLCQLPLQSRPTDGYFIHCTNIWNRIWNPQSHIWIQGVFVHWCGLRRANVVMCVWGWGPGTQGREQYWVNLVQKKRRTLKDWVSCSPTKTSGDMSMLHKIVKLVKMWKSAELRFVACVAQVAWGVSVESVGFRCIATIIPSHYYTSIDTIILKYQLCSGESHSFRIHIFPMLCLNWSLNIFSGDEMNMSQGRLASENGTRWTLHPRRLVPS